MRPLFVAALATAAASFAVLCGLRAPEPPALDQSLFVYYAQCLGRGLHLYRDLWDSKPPGLFALYAAANRVAPPEQVPRWLDALAAAGAAALVFAFARRQAGPWTALAAAFFAATLGSAPVFGGPLVAAQAEALMAPLLLASALSARRAGAAAGFAAGFLVGSAALLKLVAVVLVPIVWIAAPPGSHRDGRRTFASLAGVATPLFACGLGLALQGDLGEAVQAVLVYPRAYAAEIASRAPLLPLLQRGAERLARGLPWTLSLVACGAVWPGARPLRGVALAWLGLAAAGILLQRQMAGYHLFLLAPALAILAGRGAGVAADLVRRTWIAARAGRVSSALWLVVLAAAAAWPLALEARLWVRHHAPHVAYRFGRTSYTGFLEALGGPGPAWIEAGQLSAPIRERAGEGDRLLVWGLSPAVYAQSGLLPATRYAFHQTLLVPDSPLSRRWPDALQRRAALFESLQRSPPRFVVVVRGDRSGLEPKDSETELKDFPEFEAWLGQRYEVLRASGGGTAWIRRDVAP